MVEKTRHFTIQGSDIGFSGGHFKSDSPYKAAKKAARSLFTALEKDSKYARYKSNKSVKFLLRETTQGSEKKSYYYDASVLVLDPPEEVERAGKTIVIKRKVSIKTCHDAVTVKTPSA